MECTILIDPLEKNGGGTGGIGAKEKGGEEGLCQGAEGRGGTGEAEGSSTGVEQGVERAMAMGGEGEEEGMEGVEGGRRGLDEVREGNEGLAAEGKREVRNEKGKIRIGGGRK